MNQKNNRTLLLAPFSFFIFLLSSCSISDLRPDSIKDGISEEEVTRGKQLIEQLQKTYRRDLWQSKKALVVEYKDHWPALMPRILAMPWPENDHRVRLSMVLGKDDSFLEFLDEPAKGEIWGIQNWATYKKSADGEIMFEKDNDIWFWLPTYSYFTQLPYRIIEGEVIAFAGEREMNGSHYDTVFITWEQAEPLENIDQYVIYINKKTGYLDRVDYTIRDMGHWMVGAMYYGDTRMVDGIPVAHRQSAGDLFNGDDVVHQAEFTAIEYIEALNEPMFYPDKSRIASKYQ